MVDCKTAFEENGYLHIPGVFTAEEVAALRAEFDRIVNQLINSGEDIGAAWAGLDAAALDRGERFVLRAHNVHRYSAAWHRALLNDRLLDAAQALIGPNIVLHHTRLLHNPGRSRATMPIHQDWPCCPTVRDSVITAVIHVSEATGDMGCIRAYAGSHRLGRISDASACTPSTALQQYPLEQARSIEARPGDILFLHALTLRGSMPNLSDRAHKTVLVQMYAGDDHVEPGSHHASEQLVLRGWNFFATRNGADSGLH